MPYAPALAGAGVDVDKVLLIRTGNAASSSQDALWALEQALESGACSAVLAWLDESRLRIPDLRRIHLRAQQGRAWAILFRPGQASRNPSAAELRLRIRAADPPLQGGPSPQGGPRRLLLSIIKRRGGWSMDDLPLDLEASDGLEALLRLWRSRGGASR